MQNDVILNKIQIIERSVLPNNVYKSLLQIITSYDGIENVILFGSRAIGDHDERSDIDLAVLAPNMKKRDWLNFVFSLEENDFTLLPFDIVRLEEVPPEFYEEIMITGKSIYEKKKTASAQLP